MGIGSVQGSVAGIQVDGTRRWWSCTLCYEQNPSDLAKCRDCLSPRPLNTATAPPEVMTVPQRGTETVPRKVRPVLRRIVRKTIVPSSGPPSKLDTLRRVLNAFSRPEEVVGFQCPVCGRTVDETVAVCGCGAIFEDATGRPWGYECPVCGRRVASDSIQCRCGARFSN